MAMMRRVRLRRIGLAAALAASAILAQARTPMAAEGDRQPERTISVSASGSITAEPDMARISAGVVVEADTAREALARNSTQMKKMLDGLKALGIDARDIQTSAVNVEPRYTQARDGRPATISGYRVVNQVRLTVRDVGRLGEMLDAAIGLGANQVQGISFEVSRAEALQDEARKQAIANARRRAELYATAAGVQLGPVLQISEGSAEVGRPVFGARMAAAPPVPIEAGTQAVTVSVTVTYGLR
jgi:uncharacterized protein YggE